ncbi:hypothetical protein DIPPA_09573 [Diplonema papillatum]|nr:hypothetical protein DIPPA_09573 [Diplonema papillatum]
MQGVLVGPSGAVFKKLPAIEAIGPEQVLLSVSHCGVSCEDYVQEDDDDQPRVVGTTAVGTVIRVGENVKNRAEGDRIVAIAAVDAGRGGLAARCAAENHLCAPLPPALSPENACLLGTVLSYHLLLCQTLRASPGDVVVVPPSCEQLIAAQTAAAFGLHVIVAASDADLPALSSSLSRSANVTLVSDVNLVDNILKGTSGLGADFIFFYDDSRILDYAKVLSLQGMLVGIMPFAATAHEQTDSQLLSLLRSKSSGMRYHSFQAGLLAPTRQGELTHLLQEALRFLIVQNAAAPNSLPKLQNVSLKQAAELLSKRIPAPLLVTIQQ